VNFVAGLLRNGVGRRWGSQRLRYANVEREKGEKWGSDTLLPHGGEGKGGGGAGSGMRHEVRRRGGPRLDARAARAGRCQRWAAHKQGKQRVCGRWLPGGPGRGLGPSGCGPDPKKKIQNLNSFKSVPSLIRPKGCLPKVKIFK
jgi:hypothetical protein